MYTSANRLETRFAKQFQFFSIVLLAKGGPTNCISTPTIATITTTTTLLLSMLFHRRDIVVVSISGFAVRLGMERA